MDKYKIDSHKYAFHPQHSSNVINYFSDPSSSSYSESFRNQHPLYLEVSPVGACNHRCTFCAVDYIGYKSIFLDTDKIKQSIASMSGKGVKSIMFAGEGEPLLHKDIADIVNYTKSKCKIDVAFTTNAVRLDNTFVNKCLHNIEWIKVSFNAGDPKTYSSIHSTNERDFYTASKNIENAVNYKHSNNLNCAIGLQSLLLPDNKDSLPDLCTHAKNLGADYLVIKPYSQHKFSNTTQYSEIDYSEYMDMQRHLESFSDETFNVVFRVNTINNWISQNNDRYCKCMATPSVWAYIMADGSVYSCSAYLLDDRFKLGNILEEDFNSIWTSDRRMEHAEFVSNQLDISECRVNCRMDQVNRFLDSISNSTIPHINFV